jgi:hypothetical protein
MIIFFVILNLEVSEITFKDSIKIKIEDLEILRSVKNALICHVI